MRHTFLQRRTRKTGPLFKVKTRRNWRNVGFGGPKSVSNLDQSLVQTFGPSLCFYFSSLLSLVSMYLP